MGKIETMRHSEAMDWRSDLEESPTRTSDRMPESNTITVECHKREIPAFVEAEMERLYGNLYSSVAQLRISADLSDACTYVARKDGEPIAIFLFRLVGPRAQVLNEVIRIETGEVRRFAAYVFSNFDSVGVISFRAVQIGSDAVPYVHQRFNYLEDIVVSLPASSDHFTASLGKSTRRNMRRYLKSLSDAYPSFEFTVLERGAAQRADLMEIIELNRARMAGKSKLSSIDQAEAERLIALSKRCGLVGVARIDGRICAGAISYRVGPNYFLSVLAHDSEYNAFGLGMLCCYLTLCACIDRGGKEFHFLWGQYDYKFQFLGVQRDLDNLAIYRSRAHYLWNADFAVGLVFNWYMRKAKAWLHQGTYMSNLARRALAYARGLAQGREKQHVHRYQVDRVGKHH